MPDVLQMAPVFARKPYHLRVGHRARRGMACQQEKDRKKASLHVFPLHLIVISIPGFCTWSISLTSSTPFETRNSSM